MKELLQQYCTYNLWADKIIVQSLSALSEEQLNREIISSFPSVMKTLLHMMDAESIWWQRLKLYEQIERPSTKKELDFNEVTEQLIRFSSLWEDWVRNTNEINLRHVFEYRNTKKELFKQPVSEVVIHLVNHQTYHRGQIITMLRQLGITKIPSTDFVLFCRKK